MFYKQQYWKKEREMVRKYSFQVGVSNVTNTYFTHKSLPPGGRTLLPLRELRLPTSLPKRVLCQTLKQTNKPWAWLKLDGPGHYSPKCACPKTHVTGTQITHVTPFHCWRAVTMLSVRMWTQPQPKETSGRQEKRGGAVLMQSLKYTVQFFIQQLF
jgi:hypothetical protein